MGKNLVLTVAATVVAAGAAVWLTASRSRLPRLDSAGEPQPLSGGGLHPLAGGFSGYGWSVHRETKTCVEQALGSALRKGSEPPDVAFIVYAHPHAPERVLAAARGVRGSPRRLFGLSSYHGVIAPDGYHSSPDGAVGVLSLRVPGVAVGVGAASFDEAASPQASAQLALSRAVADAGKPTGSGPPSLIVLAPTYAGNEERILAALDAATGGKTPVLGGTAAGSPARGSSDWSVLASDRVLRNGLVLCVFYSAEPFAWSFRGGFDRTGTSGVVTASEGRVIREIDGRPALDVYDEWSGGRVREAMRAGKDTNTFCALLPLCRTLTSGKAAHNLFIHAWPAKDAEQSRCLVTSATVSQGDVVYFSEGSWNILLNRIGTLPEQAKAGKPDMRAAAALFICCEGVLKNIPPEQRAQMAFLMNRSLGGIPWIGAFTWGEQGNFPGFGNYHGNLLTSLVLLPAPAAPGE